MGVEEELMLVDPDTCLVRSVSHGALQAHQRQSQSADPANEPAAQVDLELELFQQQLETGTTALESVADLESDVALCRRRAAESAEAVGAALVCVGTPVLASADTVQVTRKDRYQRIVHEFGKVGQQGGVCGMHVHVDVAGEEEGVQVLDGLRPWLPVLRALTVNSPFWHGEDTSYASWRTQVWGQWPTTGPAEPFGDPAGYHRAADAFVASGAALDRGMLYFDARLAQDYPTVELRVLDSTTEISDVGLVAALCRALVDTVAADGSGTPPWRTDLLRAAHWRASRYGLADRLLDPVTQQPAQAREVVQTTISHVRDALDAAGDLDRVLAAFEQLMARGTGSARQRAVAESRGSLQAVVEDLRERFTASYADR